MTDKIHLYHPLHTLKPFSDGIWIADGKVIRMSFPLGVKVPFSTRMTVVRLNDGGLWCHSPVEPVPELLRQIDALGEVRHLVSPNKIHYAHIAAWKRHYPQALAWASSGVRERADDLAQLPFAGSAAMEETVFFHRASRTLILADLIENFETAKFPSRFWAGVMKLTGIANPDGKAPADWRATFKDKTAARACLKQMLDWQPEKIILAHGRCYETGGTDELRRAFRWLD